MGRARAAVAAVAGIQMSGWGPMSRCGSASSPTGRCQGSDWSRRPVTTAADPAPYTVIPLRRQPSSMVFAAEVRQVSAALRTVDSRSGSVSRRSSRGGAQGDPPDASWPRTR
ncbi:hypothetical protein ACIA7S_16070 [Streptomyces sp. NPDC051643]|uniref:hypothetical protein n=1 Tax=Streptomyces sp. NPDC051643 TaxID=3365665 RepID=UPI003794431C